MYRKAPHQYPISTWFITCVFNINNKFKNIIQKYIDLGIYKNYNKKHIFLIILQNAIIM